VSAAAAADNKKRGTIDPLADLPGAIGERLAAEPSISPAEGQRLLDQALAYRDEARALRKLADEVGPHVEKLERDLAEARAELEEKTATLRALRAIDREASRAAIDRMIAEAREEAVASVTTDLEALRSEVGRLRSENDDLRRSKRKLREALDRAREGR
jgi:uncharacterized membrane protein